MRMTDASWARHANPWSVYTRILGGTLVFFSLWSIYWIGWYSLFAIATSAFWIYINPRIFSPPRTTSSWAAKGVLGERAFLNRRAVPIPAGHARLAWITTAISAAFLAISVYGILYKNFWAAFSAWHAATVSKLWFVDRMVWLWGVMKDKHPVYQSWAQGDWTASFANSAGSGTRSPEPLRGAAAN